VRFSIRRNHKIHPLAYREGRNGSSAHEEEWNIPRPAPAPPGPVTRAEMAPVPPPPPPAAALPNGFRAQATSGDARAERLVRAVRMEVADLKQAIGTWGEARDGMLDIDLEAVQANPDVAATLPPAALARALAGAAERIRELEQGLRDRDEEAALLREEIGRLTEEHAYTKGRAEMLQEVIAALHANLEDLRHERARQAALEAPPRRALRPGERQDDPFGMGGAFK
jgi:hypothetical protein